MKRIAHAALLTILTSLALLPAHAQTTVAPKKAVSTDARSRLREFFAADWKYWMTEYPEEATVFGYPGQNSRWTDFSAASNARHQAHLKQSLAKLTEIPRGQLPASEQLNYDLYRDLLQKTVEGLRFHDDSFPMAAVMPVNLYMPVNQMQGVLQDVPNIIALMPSASAHDYEDILARLTGVPALADQVIALMRDGLAHGWAPPEITMRDVPQQAASQIVDTPAKSPLLAAFQKYPEDFTAEQKASFTARADAAYMEKVSPAFAKLRDFLQNEYVPKCRETISISALPDGDAFYRFLVRWQTTTSLTPEEIHATGLAQVKMLHDEIEATAAQAGFAGRVADFEKSLNSDPQYFAKTPEELLARYRDVAKRADPQLTLLFGKLPRLTYGVKAVPDAVAPSQTSAYYEQGSPSAHRPGYLYVNTYKLENRAKWEAEDLLLHEGVPGHHLQISLAQEMEGAPDFRGQLGYSAFVEGWALYSESLGPEMGFYATPASKFGYLSGMMWRAVRLVVDTGMHSMGWTRDQAIDYFIGNTGLSRQVATAEIDRYIVWPGQALAYKTGQLKIRELRNYAEKELGPRFDIRAFHDTVLDSGALPLNLLESRVKEWVTRQKNEPTN